MFPISASQCCLSVPSVPPISVYQCRLSVPITAASLAHISEGEKLLIYRIVFFSKFSVVFGLFKKKYKSQR
ncbi:unnamed protein product [Staurois parvus]|uniref:Uncharacterized protein n=1 Tax=Staurois parvus TaxID=386267 RepID=A0ABN9GDV5_9NEOB|nr:unnamed protein product [Staurois parvus]